MQQHDFNAPIHGKEQRFNKSKREEVIPSINMFHHLTIKKNMRMKSLKKELIILNLIFIMWLSKKLQLKALECPKDLNWYL
jgi:hypothetical protein